MPTFKLSIRINYYYYYYYAINITNPLVCTNLYLRLIDKSANKNKEIKLTLAFDIERFTFSLYDPNN